MSLDFEAPSSFGDLSGIDQSMSRTAWGDVWPSNNTSWDTFDQLKGIDMSAPAFRPFDLGDPRADRPANYRVSNFGVEFNRPELAEQGPEGHLLLPFGQGSLNPRTAYDFWNPAQALDTLVTWGRAFIPGVNEAGNFIGSVGQGVADSWFGKTVSESPVAAAGTFVGDTIFGIMKGGFQTVGDMLSPIGDVHKSYTDRDFAGALLNTIRIGPIGLSQKTWERIDGAFKNDEELKEQLADEFGFLLTVGTLGVGSATGLLAKGTTKLGAQAARIGVLKTAKTVGEEGVGYSLNPVLHNIAVATKFGLAGGYGLELGSEISAHAFPDWDNTNEFIASQRSVPMDSPFRGAFEMGVASFVDPLPAIGRLIDAPGVRKLMDSGFLRLPSPVERVAADMPGGWASVQDKSALIREMSAASLERIAQRKLEDEGFRDITRARLDTEVGRLRQTITGDGERTYMGLASDYTNLQAEMAKEIHHWKQGMEKNFPEYANRPMTVKEFEGHHLENKANWAAIKAAQTPGSRDVLMVYGSTLTDQDFKGMLNHMTALKGFKKSSSNQLTDDMRRELGKNFGPVIAHANKARPGLLGMSQRKVWQEIEGLMEFAPKEPTYGDMGNVAKLIRGNEHYKVIVKGENPVIKPMLGTDGKTVIKDVGDVQLSRFHPAVREAEELLKMRFGDGEAISLNRLEEMYQSAGKHDYARLLEKWGQDNTALYEAGGIRRPILTPNEALGMLMPEGATKLGTMISNFREMVPNTELARKFQDKFFEVHNKAWGLSREETMNYIKAIKQEADKVNNSTVNQWAAGATPHTAGKPIKELAIEMFGMARIGKTNPSQLLEVSMPTESWGKFINVLIGKQHGEVGIAGSFFAKLRASRSDRIGDFYRWWANVGHPTLRYDASPLFLFQLPFESRIYNWLRGVSNPSTDGLLAPAVNEAIDKVAKSFGGKTMGEQRNIGLSPGEALASERVSSRTGAGPAAVHDQVEFMFKQVMKEVPERFADRMRLVMPEDFALLRREYKSNKELFDAVVNDQGVKKKWLSGDIDKDEVLKMAKIIKDTKSAETFSIIETQLQGAMRDAVRQAQTTHISNPMRRYWERSFSHPVLMYPLSWTLKATGEWARFLTHSAFGYKTGMAGSVGWGHLQNATMQALIADPEAMKWVEAHPQTIKIMEYLLPGLPGSPVPGDKAGVGFGLMSVPLRNAVQTGYNVWNGRPLSENNSDMSKIGLLRDLKVAPKLWSEWVLGKPQTAIDNPGLTVGKKKHPQAFETFVNEQLSLDRR